MEKPARVDLCGCDQRQGRDGELELRAAEPRDLDAPGMDAGFVETRRPRQSVRRSSHATFRPSPSPTPSRMATASRCLPAPRRSTNRKRSPKSPGNARRFQEVSARGCQRFRGAPRLTRRYDEHLPARSPLCGPFVRQEPRLHRGRGPDARAWRRRQHGDLQRAARRRPARSAVPRRGSHRGDVDEEHPPEPARWLLLPELPRLEGAEPASSSRWRPTIGRSSRAAR